MCRAGNPTVYDLIPSSSTSIYAMQGASFTDRMVGGARYLSLPLTLTSPKLRNGVSLWFSWDISDPNAAGKSERLLCSMDYESSQKPTDATAWTQKGNTKNIKFSERHLNLETNEYEKITEAENKQYFVDLSRSKVEMTEKSSVSTCHLIRAFKAGKVD